MATPILLPRQGQSVESCIITKWHKKVGDSVKSGDTLFSYETDKAAFDEESPVDGTLLAIFFGEGEDVPVLLNVAVVGEAGEDVAAFRPDGSPQGGDEEAQPAAPTPQARPAQGDGPAPTGTAGDTLFASPRARMAADRMHVDVRSATPTGPNGRILERDVLAVDRFAPAIPTAEAAPGATSAASAGDIEKTTLYEDIPFSGIRKIIAKNMHKSLQSMAQLTHHSSFDASGILAYRKALKAGQEKLGLPNVTLNDIILYAVSRTLERHPDLNAHFLEDEGVIRRFAQVGLGMAADTPRGLLVPTLPGANALSLSEISTLSKELAASAQSGSLSPDKMEGATFTVSNLGSLGVEMFTPVINPPQVAILGVCTIVKRPREDEQGHISLYPAMGLSLTYDHRALDGAPASRFLMDLVQNLENFTLLLAK